jgi:hypothetical protein
MNETTKESVMDKKGNPGQQPSNPNPNPAPDLEAAFLELLRKLNSTVQSGRPLTPEADAAIANFRAISLLLKTKPLLDNASGVSR